MRGACWPSAVVHVGSFLVNAGMQDSWERRDATQEYLVWKDEMVWRGVYFTAIVWVSILLIHAPTFRLERPPAKKSGEDKKAR